MNDEKVETGAGGERESAGERERSRRTREEEETGETEIMLIGRVDIIEEIK